MQRILIATDESEGADRALAAAVELAKAFGAELILVHVEQGHLNSNLEEFQRSENASIEEMLFAASSAILARAQAKAATLGATRIRTHSGLGDAAGFILDVAQSEKPDVIVVGRRGRGRLSGLVLGSVSQKLVSLAPCKVMVVP